MFNVLNFIVSNNDILLLTISSIVATIGRCILATNLLPDSVEPHMTLLVFDFHNIVLKIV